MYISCQHIALATNSILAAVEGGMEDIQVLTPFGLEFSLLSQKPLMMLVFLYAFVTQETAAVSVVLKINKFVYTYC